MIYPPDLPWHGAEPARLPLCSALKDDADLALVTEVLEPLLSSVLQSCVLLCISYGGLYAGLHQRLSYFPPAGARTRRRRDARPQEQRRAPDYETEPALFCRDCVCY